MNAKLKKLLTLALSAFMALNMGAVAFAEGETTVDGGVNGTGEVEYLYDTDVFNVVLPTVPEDSTIYDFKMDPMGVLYTVEAAAEDGTLYFLTGGQAASQIASVEVAFTDGNDDDPATAEIDFADVTAPAGTYSITIGDVEKELTFDAEADAAAIAAAVAAAYEDAIEDGITTDPVSYYTVASDGVSVVTFTGSDIAGAGGTTPIEGSAVITGTDGTDPALSGKSDALTITNKSSFDVTATVKAEVTGLTVGSGDTAVSAVLTDDKTFADDETASIYLALISGATESAATAEAAAELTATITGSADAYELVTADNEDGYSYQLKSEEDLTEDGIEFADYSFQLTGACNANGVWDGLDELAPSVAVTWVVEKQTTPPAPANSAPAMVETGLTLTATDNTVLNYDLSELEGWDLGNGDLAATGVASVTWNGAVRTYFKITENDDGVACVLTTTAAYAKKMVAGTLSPAEVVLTLDDEAASTVTVTIEAGAA